MMPTVSMAGDWAGMAGAPAGGALTPVGAAAGGLSMSGPPIRAKDPMPSGDAPSGRKEDPPSEHTEGTEEGRLRAARGARSFLLSEGPYAKRRAGVGSPQRRREGNEVSSASLCLRGSLRFRAMDPMPSGAISTQHNSAPFRVTPTKAGVHKHPPLEYGPRLSPG